MPRKNNDDEVIEDEEVVEDGPRQHVGRFPAEEVGPFFPSGMSAPEAAMAGATADLSDEDKDALANEAANYGLDSGEVAAEDE